MSNNVIRRWFPIPPYLNINTFLNQSTISVFSCKLSETAETFELNVQGRSSQKKSVKQFGEKVENTASVLSAYLLDNDVKL